MIARLDAASVDALFDPQRFLVNLGRCSSASRSARRRPALTLVAQGKVRDIFEAGDDRLLLVATDRISAFDVVLPTPIPDKGRVLTACSLFWFEQTADIVPNHLSDGRRAAVPAHRSTTDPELAGRATLVRARRRDPDGMRRSRLPRRLRLDGLPRRRRRLRHRAPGRAGESQRLPEPIFTPTTKAAEGHDLPLTPDEARALVGAGPVRAAARAERRDLRADRRSARSATA